MDWNDLVILADATVFNAVGLLFVVLGVYVLIRAAGFPDLTVDGSFTIGAAVYSVTLAAGFGTLPALLAALLAGSAGGLLTWSVNNVLGVGKVVSGVLSMIILVLIAPYVTKGSTQSLLNVNSIHSYFDGWDAALTRIVIPGLSYRLHWSFSAFWLVLFLVTVFMVYRFLSTRTGIQLRYSGGAASPVLVPAGRRKVLLAMGLAMGNGLVAIGGAIEAQRRGGFTVNMGTGMILVSLAALVLGESLIKSWRKRDYLHMKEYVASIIMGAMVYAFGVQIILLLGIAVIDLRLMTAFFLLALLGYAGRFHSSSTKLF